MKQNAEEMNGKVFKKQIDLIEKKQHIEQENHKLIITLFNIKNSSL